MKINKYFLPKITNEIREEFIDTELIEIDENGKCQWTQLAVDFAGCLNQALYADAAKTKTSEIHFPAGN